ncbi:uncharacterized protein LOC116161620 [Photinus pyralis]|uniref:uncharacterized protein LOC116161620 n=1 Tax=Photinus pyralis TaxID=7054 RepID=UPI001267520F|nr:uncharacterized protein LOC116161620 [Photinus pyralis]
MDQSNSCNRDPYSPYTNDYVAVDYGNIFNSIQNLPVSVNNEGRESNYNLGSPDGETILDISGCEDQPIQDLTKLLKEWKQEFLLEHFVQQKVFVDVLKVIKSHHLERLLKDFEIGIQIVFEHNLEQWRQSMGAPLLYSGNTSTLTSPLSPTSSCSSSRASSPAHDSRVTPYCKEQPDSQPNIPLSTILYETTKGVMLTDFYNKFSKLQEEQRTILITLVAQFHEDKGIAMTLAGSYRLEREILERFPTERLEYYRSNKRGRIYNKFCNLKKSVGTAIGKYVSNTKSKNQPEKKYRLEKNFEPETDGEACLRALKYDNLSSEQIDSTWKACSQYRLHDIKTFGDTGAIIDKWSLYKSPSGFRLIDMDFTVAFSNGEGLLDNWEKCYDKILTFLFTDSNLKDKNLKLILEEIRKNGSLSENSRTASLLWALHGYFVPTNKSVKKDETGKNQTIKFTIKDSQESFLFLGKSFQEVEDHLNHLGQRMVSIQPFVYCIGDDILSITDIFIYFDNIRYKFFSVLRAIPLPWKSELKSWMGKIVVVDFRLLQVQEAHIRVAQQ